MDKRIVKYLHKNSVTVLATINDAGLWSTNLFYAFDEVKKSIIFISQGETRHSNAITHDSRVSGAIYTSNSNILKLKGVQFTGVAMISTDENDQKTYFAKFPYARAIAVKAISGARFYVVTLDRLKYTDNTLGFGKKIVWEHFSGSSPEIS